VRASSGNAVRNSESPEQQLTKCRLQAHSRYGLQIPDEFVFAEEGAITATKADVLRRGFEDLLRGILARRFHLVISYDSKRLRRNELDALRLMDACRKAGVVLESTQEGTFDFSKRMDRNRYRFQTMVDVDDAEGKAEDSARGKRWAYAQGYWVAGLAPFGYRTAGVKGKTILERDEMAHHVTDAYRLYAEGWSLGKIRDELNRRGAWPRPSGRARKPWAGMGGISYLLRNPTYLGWTRWLDLLEDPRDPQWCAPYERRGEWPPLVEPDLWRRVQRRLAQQRQRFPGRPRRA